MAWTKMASGKQLSMLYAIATARGLRGWKGILEWLEYESSLKLSVIRPEDIQAQHVNTIKRELERLNVVEE